MLKEGSGPESRVQIRSPIVDSIGFRTSSPIKGACNRHNINHALLSHLKSELTLSKSILILLYRFRKTFKIWKLHQNSISWPIEQFGISAGRRWGINKRPRDSTWLCNQKLLIDHLILRKIEFFIIKFPLKWREQDTVPHSYRTLWKYCYLAVR